MYKYLLFRLWVDSDDCSKAEQLYSSNNYHSVLSWMISSSRGSEDDFVIVDQSKLEGFRQCLH